MDDHILTTTGGGARTITLNRPEARNALTRSMIRSLSAELLAAERDPAVKVVILTGTDPAFCAGLDLKETLSLGLDEGMFRDPERNPWEVLRAMGTPVIGAVNGFCITGGLELALHCSFLIASDQARFADTHAKVGLHPGGGATALLPQAIGLRRAKQMTFTAEVLDAPEAFRLGLVNEVVPHAELLPAVARMAEAIAAHDTRTVTAINHTYRDVAETTLLEGQRLETQRCLEWKPA